MKSLFTIVCIAVCYLATATEVTWDNGGLSTDWNDALNWDTNVIPTATDSVNIPAGFTVIIPAAFSAVSGHMHNEGDFTIDGSLTIDGISAQGFSNRNILTVNGSLVVQNLNGISSYNGIINALGGVVTNNGTIEIDNVDGALLINSNPATFENNGDILLSNNGGGSSGLSNADIFNNNTGATIDMETTGQLLNSGNFANHLGASINIFHANSFAIQNQDTLTNNGVIDISLSGASGITNGELIINNGTINITRSASSGIQQSQAQTQFVNNGTLNISRSNSHGLYNTNSTFFHNTATGDLTISLNVSAGILNRFVSTTLNDTTSFVNDGMVTLTNNGAEGIGNITSSSAGAMGRAILVNSGTIDITSSSTNDMISNRDRSTIDNLASGTIQATRTIISSFGILRNNQSNNHDPTINNLGTIELWNGPLNNLAIFNNSGNISVIDSQHDGISNNTPNAFFNNSGTIQITNSLREGLNNNAATFINTATGIIQVDTSGLSGVRNGAASFTNLGIIEVDETATFGCVENLSSSFGTGQFENVGSITVASSQPAAFGVYNRIGGVFENKPTGQIVVNAMGGNRGINNAGSSSVMSTFDNEGTIDLTDNNVQNSAGSFTNFVGASMTGNDLTNYNSFIPSLFTNAGTLTFAEDLQNSEDFVNESTGVIHLGAIMVGGNSLSNNGVFSGEGTINLAPGTQAIQNATATWSPGFSPGTITINGDADYASVNTTYQVELESLVSYDETIVNGDLSVGGILDVTLLSGFVPSATDVFPIFTYSGTLTGTFTTVNLPSPEMDGFTVNYGTFSPGQVVIGPGLILPVEFSSFDAQVNEERLVKLVWQTESETNNDFFDIERSQNGIHFQTIGREQSRTLSGPGTHSDLLAYQFMDEAPLNGVSYYRLKQVDLDGAFEYSETRSVWIESNQDAFNVYPNPTTNYITILSSEKINDMKIYNQEGQDVLTIQPDQRTIDVSNLPKGYYYLHISTIKGNYKKPVVIM